MSTSPAESSDVHQEGAIGTRLGDDRMVRCEGLTLIIEGDRNYGGDQYPERKFTLIETFEIV